MDIIKTSLEGALLIEPRVFGDKRGFFLESYNKRKFSEAGIDIDFVQDNHSGSSRGTLRGLHYQINPGQDKLVRVTSGEVFDVIVDIRKNSPTFGKWESFILSSENRKMLFVPRGFAHGFCVMSESADFLYKCSEFYSPEDERGILWSDPELAIPWPSDSPILSEKDREYPCLRNAVDFF